MTGLLSLRGIIPETSGVHQTGGSPDGTASYSYDAAGNTLTAGSDNYSWDWANRLTNATVNSVSTTYTYDGDDTRTSATTGGNTSAYLWDRLGDVELLIDDGANAYLHEGGILTAIDTNSDTTSSLNDGLGSVRHLTDETGSLTGSADYDAFGTVTSQSGTSSTFGYTGEQTDPSGDLYLRARTYDPETGRFLSADTVQPNAPGTQGYNRYAYVANNATTWTDPTGHVAAVGVLQPVLRNPGWLPIGIYLGYQYAVLACSVAPLGCLGLAVAIIVVFAIVACVLEIGGPCWTWERQRSEIDLDKPITIHFSSYPDPKFAEQLAKQLAEHGKASVCRSYRSLKKQIEEHQEKLPSLKYPGKVEREIKTFKKQLETLEKFLREKGITC